MNMYKREREKKAAQVGLSFQSLPIILLKSIVRFLDLDTFVILRQRFSLTLISFFMCFIAAINQYIYHIYITNRIESS